MKEHFLTKNNAFLANQKRKVIGGFLHSTGANNPNLSRYIDGFGINKYGNHWNQPKPDGREICCHGFIGKDADGSVMAVQTLPFGIRGWHSGSGKKGNADAMGYVGCEICEDNLKDYSYFLETKNKALDFFEKVFKDNGLIPDATNMICHSEGYTLGIASNHSDVMHWWKLHDYDMNKFRKELLERFKTKVLYKVQVGAFSSKENAEKLMNELKQKGYDAFCVTSD